jgi:adenine-specific DNA methylase
MDLVNIDNASVVYGIKKIFVEINEIIDFLYQCHGIKAKVSDVELLIDIGVLPVYDQNGNKLFLFNDLYLLINHFRTKKNRNKLKLSRWSLFDNVIIDIDKNTFFIPSKYDHKKFPSYSAALKNIFEKCNSLYEYNQHDNEKCICYLGGSKLITFSASIDQIATKQVKRASRAEETAHCIFSKSASYMGSKNALGGFIVEAIFSVLPKHGVVVDLMCGSGVSSAAFANNWRTIASDSQTFCTTLAKIHGKGSNVDKAHELLDKILPAAETHFSDFCNRFNDAIIREDKFFCSDTNRDLQKNYADFIASFPRISTGGVWDKWNPIVEIDRRQKNTKLVPYCLFTAYFSNVFFGLRQCVEIDSLRYAIDQLQNEEDRIWATGALITTTSAIGSTYGGHFAQPLVKDIESVTLDKLSKIIDKRSVSVTLEFSKRLVNLSEQSQKQSFPVEIVKGPWRKSISFLESQLDTVPVLVYLDAPYKREEYSRYYHVLETLCLYNYPSCTGLGLIPKPAERFRSEFFTRTSSQLNKIFVELICEILDKGWMCAWSYSSSGAADICAIVSEISSRSDCGIKSYAVPAIHKSHGGAKPKSVTEYLIVFSPLVVS